MIGGHEPGRLPLAAGQPHQDRGRLAHEIEGAGNNVAAWVDDQPGRRARAQQHAFDLLQAADGFDPHHGRRHAIDGRLECRLFLSADVVGGCV